MLGGAEGGRGGGKGGTSRGSGSEPVAHRSRILQTHTYTCMTPERVGIRRRHTYSGYFTWSVFRIRRLAPACIQYPYADTGCIHASPARALCSGSRVGIASCSLMKLGRTALGFTLIETPAAVPFASASTWRCGSDSRPGPRIPFAARSAFFFASRAAWRAAAFPQSTHSYPSHRLPVGERPRGRERFGGRLTAVEGEAPVAAKSPCCFSLSHLTFAFESAFCLRLPRRAQLLISEGLSCFFALTGSSL